MDQNRLKGRPPYPFETIAVGVAFSPRLQAVLCEARQLARIFGAQLLLIHVGRQTPGKEEVLADMCRQVGIGPETRVLWRTGDTVSALLKTCKEHIVDLLVLGALRQESMFRYYLGSVARGLSRRAKCSLLLLTEPRAEGSAFRTIMVDCVEHPKTASTIETAFYFASRMHSEDVWLVKEVDPAGLAMVMSDESTDREREAVKAQLLLEAEEAIRWNASLPENGEMRVTSAVLWGRPGFAIRRFAGEKTADLLAVNSPDSRYGLIDRIFTHDMEYILEHLPCNILIVHSRSTSTT